MSPEERDTVFYQLPAVMAVPHRPEGSVSPPASMERGDLEQWGAEMTEALGGLLDWSKEMHSSIYDSYIPQTDRIENMVMVGDSLEERPDPIGSRRFFYHRSTGTLYLDVRYGDVDLWDVVAGEASAVVLDTTNFDNLLSPSDSNLQSAMETLDDHLHDAVLYLTEAPAVLADGMIWMESDGLHIYYAGAEKVVAGV